MKKALLIKVREKIISTDDEDFFGLCTLVYLMAQNDEITEEQHDSLLEFMYNNKPKRNQDGSYWWERKNKGKRINWLNRQIRKLNY